MMTPIQSLFKKQLLSEDFDTDMDTDPQDDAPQFGDMGDDKSSEFDDFPSSDTDSFEDGLDPDTNPRDFDTEGLGFDAEATDVENFSEVYNKVFEIKDLMASLIDPSNPENLTRLLANFDRKDSIGEGLLQKLVQPIRKATDSLASVTNQLDIIASSEEALARKIEGIQNKY